MGQRDDKGKFVKGNNASGIAKQKRLVTKKILDETEALHQLIYQESLRQLLEAIEKGELDKKELIQVQNNLSEHVSAKKPRADKQPPSKLRSNIKDIKDLLGEE